MKQFKFQLNFLMSVWQNFLQTGSHNNHVCTTKRIAQTELLITLQVVSGTIKKEIFILPH